ncbi:MAG: hypothetical protein ABIA21_04205 [Candidatus Aenigmatarchaeota archaeon]
MRSLLKFEHGFDPVTRKRGFVTPSIYRISNQPHIEKSSDGQSLHIISYGLLHQERKYSS